MTVIIITFNRFIKIIGTIVKTLSYPFHFIFPKIRFTIPEQSSPIFSSNKQTLIPKIIWQTNYSNRVSLPMYINYLFNRLMSLQYEYRYVSTEARLEFILNNAPKELSDAYQQLTDGASQADLWRLFTLNFYGGTYMDIDAHLVWPLGRMTKENDTEIFLLNKNHYTNYFISTTKNNPIIGNALKIIVDNIEHKRIEGGVYNLTGPNVLNTAIGDNEINFRYYRETCIQGSFTNEYFQYIDKPRGKWIHAKREDLLKSKT